MAPESLQENMFNSLCLSVHCICCVPIALSPHGSPALRPREFLFPAWSETVKLLLSYVSRLWVALAEQIVLLFCSKNILLFLIIQYMIVYVKEHFN